MDVAAAQPGQLGDPQPGLDRDQQQRVVATAYPPAGVRGGEQRVDLLTVEEAHDRPVVALGWDGQHPSDQRGVLGVLQCGLSPVDDYP